MEATAIFIEWNEPYSYKSIIEKADKKKRIEALVIR